MSLKTWQSNGWLRPHQTSAEEISSLLDIVQRDLKDCQNKGLSYDWQFGIAYNATLKLCTILLYSSGFRPEKNLAHYRTLQSLALILGSEYETDTDYLDTCRIKRNETEYDFAGGISDSEAKELIEYAKNLFEDVQTWLKQNHPKLLKKK